MATAKEENDQEELTNLLDSALKDFGKPRTSDDDLDDLMEEFDRESIQKAAKNFNAMLEKMAEQVPTSNNEQTASDTSEAQFMENINKFLHQNTEVANATDDQGFMDAIRNLDENNPTVDGLMGAILQTALSRDVMYPAVKEMHERFIAYMNDKKDELDAEKCSQYSTQINIIGELRKEYESDEKRRSDGTNAEEQSMRIGQLWVELQKAGLPPPEVAGSDELLAGNSNTNALPSEACSLM